jgi:hypothetical protein
MFSFMIFIKNEMETNYYIARWNPRRAEGAFNARRAEGAFNATK